MLTFNKAICKSYTLTHLSCGWYMETLVLIFRILFIVIASLTSIIYILLQLYQKLPKVKLNFVLADYIVYSIVSVIFGFGTDSYYGLLAFIPLLLAKIAAKSWIVPNRISGSGLWIELDWKKLTPKGFDRNVSKQILDEINKMLSSTPNDTHFIIPRIYARIAIAFMMRKMKKDNKKMPAGLTAQQKDMGMNQFTTLAQSILSLEVGKSEKKDLHIGILRITRL
ncbi:hypothetical protein JCM31447_24650 [Fluviispira sanaruensis]|uniref:Uncharacterized protein n=2 Tax=Fluviispira sanaruensis TaxID=2493639 RepID=A0A4P2VMK7_FLUSA|nr:hypothetical protein JCM31447_24650 [Fluviispira sanaruensis]